jgi:hypothetical protein
VLIQFGHNDQPGKGERTTDAAGSYRDHLRAFVGEVREQGGVPVLVTPVARRIYEDGRLVSSLLPYVEGMKVVAEELQVPLVDLHETSFLLFSQRGETFCRRYGPAESDRTHFSREGARMMARLVVEQLGVVVPELGALLVQRGGVSPEMGFRVDLEVVSAGFDEESCWVHPRAGAIPGSDGGEPSVVMTMQKLLLKGSDLFGPLNDLRTDDLGRTWSGIREHGVTLGQKEEPGGVTLGVCDFTPKWHAASGKLLGIGHTVRYAEGRVMPNRKRETSYAVYDPERREWAPWRTVEMPDEACFYNVGAGCVQRVDLESGEILLPVYFKGKENAYYRVTVLRCGFDGETLTYLGRGNELVLEEGRGVYEPSLARVGSRYFLTLRNDTAGYVAVSEDGQQFGPMERWCFDDGEELGTYNTQQHWVSHGEDLYLVYTRRGLHNDHVIRHRAPLLMGKVDQTTLRVLRASEVILVPERGARLGNFAVCEVGEDEVWVTVSEWMQSLPPTIPIPRVNPFGADNRVYAASIRWLK